MTHHKHHMHRKMFLAFGAAIFATMLCVWLVMWILGGHGQYGWRRQIELAQKFVGGQFARVWDQPAERKALTQSVARDLHVGVRLTDDEGAVLDEAAWPRSCERDLHADVSWRGRVSICLDNHRGPFRPWMTVFFLGVPVIVLWGMAGLWARKMARPLRELTAVARDLGDGKLDRRVRLRHGHRGEVGELTHAINDMAARIEKQLRDQRELLAAVSHEMRTPLARVRLLCEIGRDTGKDVFGEIEGEVIEMDRLVGDLLAGARLDFGVTAPRDLDAREVATRALARAPVKARLDDAAAPADLTVHADATLLARALAALLDNAAKHAAGSAIVLRVAARDQGVVFEVDDGGPGFGAGLDRVFDPFWQADRSDARGLGLGLAIVRRIAQAHRGKAYAQNLPEGGARVGIWLPAP